MRESLPVSFQNPSIPFTGENSGRAMQTKLTFCSRHTSRMVSHRPVGMYPAYLAAEFRSKIQVVYQIPLIGERYPVRRLAVTLYVEYGEGRIDVGRHAGSLAYHPPGAFLGRVDDGQ